MTLSPSAKLIASLLVVLALAAVLMAAIAVDRLGDLIGGLAVTGIVSIVLAMIGVWLYKVGGLVKLELNRERNRHVEEMFKQGALPNNNQYQLLPQPELEHGDIPVSTSGETSTTIVAYRGEAVEVLAASVMWLRSNTRARPNQLVPYSAAKKFEYFRSGEGFVRWQNGVKFLIVNKLAAEKITGKRKEGTFINSGTAEQLYQKMKSETVTLLQ